MLYYYTKNRGLCQVFFPTFLKKYQKNSRIAAATREFVLIIKLLLVGHQHSLAAHVGAQHFGDGHSAIGLQVVFQESDQHTRRGHAGVVQGMSQLRLAVLILIADVQAACLGITQVRAAANLKILLLAGAPGFDIAALDLQVSQIAGAALQLANGDLHGAEQLDRVLPQLIVPGHAVLGLADDDHFLLLKLVDAVDAALLNAVGTLFLTEAGAVAGQGQGQLFALDGLVDEAADHGMLGSADQIEVLALDLVHHGVHLGEGHNRP